MSTQAFRMGLGLALVLWMGALPASAQNARFQNFMFAVCTGTPTGSLGTRCGETPGGGGDLSTDSEDSLNPSQTVRLNESGLERARALSREIQERLESRREGEESDASQGGSLAEKISFFGTGRLEFADRDDSRLERGFDSESYGVQIGGDLRLGTDGFVGMLVGYDRSDLEFDRDDPALNFVPQGDDGEVEGDHFGVDLYGSMQLGEGFYADASVGYGYADYELDRRAIFQETNRVVAQTNVDASSDTDAHQFRTTAALGYDAAIGGTTLGPYARVHYAVSRFGGFDESGTASGLAMDVDAASYDSLTSVAGVRASHAFSLPFGVLVPQVRFEWEHEFMADRQDLDASFLLDAAGNEFELRGSRPDQDFFNLAGALSLLVPGGWTAFADYEALLGHQNRERHRINVGVRKELR